MINSKTIQKKITVVDTITLLYVLLTSLFILFFNQKLEGFVSHLLIRIGIVTFIFLIAFLIPENAPRWAIFLRQAYPLALLAFFYPETDFLNNLFFHNLDNYLIQAEKFLFGGMPSISFYQLFPQYWFNELMNFGYASYFFVITGICVYVFFKNNQVFFKTLFIIIFSFYCCYILFIIFPTAGPQFHLSFPDNAIGDAGFFRSLVKAIDSMGEGPTGAFPSSHVGIAVILVYLCFKNAKPLLWIYIPVCTILCISTVYLKAHYLVDVVGGLIAAPILYNISKFVYHKMIEPTH